jgi:hypothetical protein
VLELRSMQGRARCSQLQQCDRTDDKQGGIRFTTLPAWCAASGSRASGSGGGSIARADAGGCEQASVVIQSQVERIGGGNAPRGTSIRSLFATDEAHFRHPSVSTPSTRT